MEKGELNGECNRTVCTKTPARFYNHSTQKHYCHSCACLINSANHVDAMALYGHNLCTIVPQTIEDKK